MRLQISIFQGAYDNSIMVSFANHSHHKCWMGYTGHAKCTSLQPYTLGYDYIKQ